MLVSFSPWWWAPDTTPGAMCVSPIQILLAPTVDSQTPARRTIPWVCAVSAVASSGLTLRSSLIHQFLCSADHRILQSRRRHVGPDARNHALGENMQLVNGGLAVSIKYGVKPELEDDPGQLLDPLLWRPDEEAVRGWLDLPTDGVEDPAHIR